MIFERLDIEGIALADIPAALASLAAEQGRLAAQQSALVARLIATPKAGDESEKLLTAEQIAERFSVAKSWPYEQARLGNLPCIKLGRYRRFRLADVEAAIAKRNEA